MARPHKPHWHARSASFRCKIGGKPVHFPKTIGRYDRPLIDGVPKAAWDWLDEYKRSNLPMTGQAITVFMLCQLYLQWLEGEAQAREIAQGTYEIAPPRLARFWEFKPPGPDPRALKDRLVTELTTDIMTDFVRAQKAEGMSPHYISGICTQVQTCLNWGCRPVKGQKPLIASNPVKGFTAPRPRKAPERYIEPHKMRAFLKWCWRRARATKGKLQRPSDLVFVRLLWFLALTGARPGEACSARWDHIDWRNHVLILEEWKNRKATGELREIQITPPVARLLRKIKRLNRSEVWVFTHRRGKGQAELATASEGCPWNPTNFGYKLRKWRRASAKEWELAQAAGKDVGELPIVVEGAGRFVAYMLRHSYISEGLHAGLQPTELAELCGTSAEMINSTYGHIQRKHNAKKAQELAEKLRANAAKPSSS